MRDGWGNDMRDAAVILSVCGLAFSVFIVALVVMVGCLAGGVNFAVEGDWLRVLACFGGLVLASAVAVGVFAFAVTFPGNYYFRP